MNAVILSEVGANATAESKDPYHVRPAMLPQGVLTMHRKLSFYIREETQGGWS